MVKIEVNKKNILPTKHLHVKIDVSDSLVLLGENI